MNGGSNISGFILGSLGIGLAYIRWMDGLG